MTYSLKVTIQNICLFVLGDSDAEGWILKDEANHVPYLMLDSARMTLPATMGGDRYDLTGCVVCFGSGDANNQANEFPSSPSTSGGSYWDRLVDLDQVVPGARLKSQWTLGKSATMPADMATRVMLSGGVITPQIRAGQPGDLREFKVGPKIEQFLATESTFTIETGKEVPFVRVYRNGVPEAVPLIPDASGQCTVTLGAKEVHEKPALDLKYDVAFVTEFSVFEKALVLPGGKTLPIPHSYWPEYGGETDPDGGPCPQAVIDLRTVQSMLAALRLRFVKAL